MIANLEINFQRLMSKCEELAADQKNNDWRFEKYVLSLEDLLKSLSKTAAKFVFFDKFSWFTYKSSVFSKLPQHTLKEYSKRVEFLKEMSTSHNKTSSLPIIINPGPINTAKDTQKKQIYQQLQVNQENALRDELFSTSNGYLLWNLNITLDSTFCSVSYLDNNTNLRDNETTGDVDLDKLLAEQQKEQDKIAEEMIEVAKRIKENTLHANSIIKSDNKVR